MRYKILIVEDDKQIREIITDYFEDDRKEDTSFYFSKSSKYNWNIVFSFAIITYVVEVLTNRGGIYGILRSN